MKIITLSIVLAATLVAAAYAPVSQATETGATETGARETGAAEMEAVTLRDSVVVSRSRIRLGDLFAGTGDKSETAVAYAPDPGRRAIFDARWLYRLARSYGLKWRPLSLRDQAVVERSSIVIGIDEIKSQVIGALAAFGVSPDMEVELSNRVLRIHIAADKAATLEVEDMVYNARTRRFAAILAAPAGDPAAIRHRVTGRVHAVTEMPVLARRMMAGEVIREGDIRWLRIRTGRLQRNTVLDASGLIGKAARRGLRPGLPVRTFDVRTPILVAKGSLVTLVLKGFNMTLTAKGRAVEAGGAGDTIRVTNTQSNTVVEGIVTGAGRVTVRSANQVAMN